MTNTQNINNNLSDLTLVIPAKEETDCLWHVLEELKNYNFQKLQASWRHLIESVHDKFGSWDTRKNYKNWELIEV